MRRFTDLVADRRGGIGVASAAALTMLIGAAALAVDIGSFQLDRRKLQGIADAAALAAAGKPGEERTICCGNLDGGSARGSGRRERNMIPFSAAVLGMEAIWFRCLSEREGR